MSLYEQYNKSLNYLASLSNIRDSSFFTGARDPKHYLKRARLLYKLAGNPEKSAKKIIVITGTSGKGTSCNILHQILTESGHRVGTYFSPHPTTAIERIKVNNQYISPKKFVQTVEKSKPIIKKCWRQFDVPSYFESFLLIALLYFKQKKCDIIIIEAGCGGRHDAANALSRIDIAAITNIGRDHLHIIGPTLKDVAHEKAGIIHQNVCFTTEKKKSFLTIFQNQTKKTNSNLVKIDCNINPNRELAKSIAKHLKIKKTFIEKGIEKAKLPCRFEIIQKKPLTILDSAHNPDKLKYLRQKLNDAIAEGELRSPERIHLVFALSAPKNIKAYLKPLLDNFNCRVYATRFLISERKATDPKKIAKAIKKHWRKTKCEFFLDPRQAFYQAKKNLKSNQILIITGSTYLCGELRKQWISEELILKTRNSLV